MIAFVLLRVLLILLLVAANAFFAAAEFSLVSVRDTRIQQLIAAGRTGARIVQRLRQNLDEVVNGVQLGITLASLTLGWLGEPFLAHIAEAAIGRNPRAAAVSGVPVQRIRLITFIASAGLSGVAGILYVAYLPSATPSLGSAYELHAVAAAVLGGCSLLGGRGSVFGVLIGAGIMQITFNAVNLVGKSLWQNVVAGGVILAAVIVDRVFERSASRRRVK